MTQKCCRRCGCRLASDHSGDEWCTPCLASRRDYDPKNDPFFLDEVLHYLVLFSPQRIELYKVMGLRVEDRQLIKDAVWKLRRRGFDIRAEARSRGYRYMGVVEISHTTSERRYGTMSEI